MKTAASYEESKQQTQSFTVLLQDYIDCQLVANKKLILQSWSERLMMFIYLYITAITANYVTVTAPLGSRTSLRVYVSRYCNIRRICWKNNGDNMAKYKGKLIIPFTDVKFSDEGIYEAYLRGRYKSNWRRIVRLLVSLNSEFISKVLGNSLWRFQ